MLISRWQKMNDVKPIEGLTNVETNQVLDSLIFICKRLEKYFDKTSKTFVFNYKNEDTKKVFTVKVDLSNDNSSDIKEGAVEEDDDFTVTEQEEALNELENLRDKLDDIIEVLKK